MPRNWIDPQPLSVPNSFSQAVGGLPLVSEMLYRRGITSPEDAAAFLDPSQYTPSSPSELPGLVAAVDRIQQAIRDQEQICVWGDFDVDGQTATTILVETLRDHGANIVYHIPVRGRESHGVHLSELEKIISAGAQLLLTCDTGITAHEAIAFANSRHVDCIITDHHDLPAVLPQAQVIVNSKMLPPFHPLGTLPGAGVAFKLAEELYRRNGREEESQRLIDLAALGIIADLAAQTSDARYLVQRGLSMMRSTTRLGLQAIMESAQIIPGTLDETQIGFLIAPRLNALGRLSDANVAVDLFTTQDLGRAHILATILEGLNAKRRLMTQQVDQAIQAQIEKNPSLLDDPILIFSNPAWPAGIIGIVASRLVDRYHRPAILFSNPPGETARGSARSIEGVNITFLIDANKDVLRTFGGHPMAAGLSLDSDLLPEFHKRMIRSVGQTMAEYKITSDLAIDGYLSLPEFTLEFALDLGRLAPFGTGNPPPILACRDLIVKSHCTIGKTGEHRQLIVADEAGNKSKVLWWQGADGQLPEGKFDLACTVRASTFRGQPNIQIEWVDSRPHATESLSFPLQSRLVLQDHRQEESPIRILHDLTTLVSGQVWCSYHAKQQLQTKGIVGRYWHELEQGDTLFIWSLPPGPKELRAAMATVSPKTVYCFGIPSGNTDFKLWTEELVGLLKYSLNRKMKPPTTHELASIMGHRESTIQSGIAWLMADLPEGNAFRSQLVENFSGLPLNAQLTNPQLKDRILGLLAETEAYRAYFRSANIGNVLEESNTCAG